jgi:F1F0 ATPase subunit 2
MNDILNLAPALIAGLVLGGMFFGGLWRTIQKGVHSSHPTRWFFGSLLLRMSMTLVGFHLVSNGHWEKLLSCLLGFLLARLLVTRLLRQENRDASLEQEAGHAP